MFNLFEMSSSAAFSVVFFSSCASGETTISLFWAHTCSKWFGWRMDWTTNLFDHWPADPMICVTMVESDQSTNSTANHSKTMTNLIMSDNTPTGNNWKPPPQRTSKGGCWRPSLWRHPEEALWCWSGFVGRSQHGGEGTWNDEQQMETL